MIEFKDIIDTEEDLRTILGNPSELVSKKTILNIDKHCRDFISKSPIVFISTSNKQGLCDVSPRGDIPGFVACINDDYLVIPERPGNKRCDSLTNIISNPNIGMIFLIPGLKETLRINGKAFVTNDEDILSKHEVEHKRPKLAIVVKVEECYIHCAKAFMRSKIWQQEFWIMENELPVVPNILADHVNHERYTSKEISEALEESYSKRLY